MTKEQSLVSADHVDLDPFTSSQARERTLNTAIVEANISESFEEYLDIFDIFYDDDIEITSDTGETPIRGKAQVHSLLAEFLMPLHVMAELNGLLVSIRLSPIPGDVAGETQSAWTVELIGVSGKTCIVSWHTLRKWNGARVVYEHHYDVQQSGGPLTSDDLGFNVFAAA